MEMIGYSLVDGDGNELQKWGDTKGQQHGLPSLLVLPNGDQVMGFKVGDVFEDGSSIVERWLDDPSPLSSREIGRDITFDGSKTVVTVSYEYVPPSPEELVAYAADVRWRKEVAGVEWSEGLVIQTDRESQGKLLAEFVAISGGLRPDPSPWKFADNKFAMLSNADMGAVCLASRAHVAAAYATEDVLVAQIDAGTITTAAQIDAAFGS